MEDKLKITDKIEIELRRKKSMNDKLMLRGNAIIERRKKDGTVIDREIIKNLIVNVGKERVAKLINKISATGFDAIAIGTGTNSAQASDTTLQTETTRASATKSYVANYKAVFEKTFEFGSGEDYDITEAGIFDSAVASGSTMLDRFTFTAKSVDADTDLYVKITITVG
jgi:ribosomal protein S17